MKFNITYSDNNLNFRRRIKITLSLQISLRRFKKFVPNADFKLIAICNHECEETATMKAANFANYRNTL